MEYLYLALTFLSGGGFMALVNWKIQRKSQKVDFADKAIAFMDKQNDNLMERVAHLEAEVEKLKKFKCERTPCKTRIPPES